MPSLRRATVLLLTACLPTVGVLVLPFQGAQAKPHPVAPGLARVALQQVTHDIGAQRLSASEQKTAREKLRAERPRTAPGQPQVIAESDPTAVPALAVAGVTWQHGTATGASVQYRTEKAGRWGPWTFVTADQEHGPDPREAARSGERDGSDPLAVTDADRLQVRVLGDGSTRASTPELVVVDPRTAPADASVGTTQPGSAQAAVSRPYIYTRAQWGADESLRDKSALTYGAVKAAVIHHTVNSNTYTSSQVPALIRGIYAYHVQGRGWADIGYNFLVDRFGRMWEGRYGGINRPVVGAHTLNHNSWTTGIAVIGNFQTGTVPSPVTRSLQVLVAWKSQIHQINPAGIANIGGGLTTSRVLGHRNAYQTECPGRYLYAKLPTIRAGAAGRLHGLPSLSIDRDLDNGGAGDFVATNANHDLLLYNTTDVRTVAPAKVLGRGAWVGVDLVKIVGDFSGDGAVDLVARQPSTGRLLLYAGSGVASLRASRVIGVGWNAIDEIIGAGDWTGDGHPDLLARVRSDGSLRLYPGNGRGGFLAPRTVGVGWGGMRLISGVGDLSGDGLPDLFAVANDGSARIYRGNGAGRFAGWLPVAGNWSRYVAVAGVGDASSDTRPDLFVVDAAGVGAIAAAGSPGNFTFTRQTQSWAGVSVYSG